MSSPKLLDQRRLRSSQDTRAASCENIHKIFEKNRKLSSIGTNKMMRKLKIRPVYTSSNKKRINKSQIFTNKFLQRIGDQRRKESKNR